jgi:hypothetical protein
MTPRQYWTACRLHDWLYIYTEDRSVYRAGREERHRLEVMARHNPALKDIFVAWHAHHFDCGPVPTEPKIEDETITEEGEKTMKYAITNTVPVPKARKRGGGRNPKYPFMQMTRGDSFFAPGLGKRTVYGAAYYIVKKTGGKAKFKVMEVNENGVSGTRVWRVK